MGNMVKGCNGKNHTLLRPPRILNIQAMARIRVISAASPTSCAFAPLALLGHWDDAERNRTEPRGRLASTTTPWPSTPSRGTSRIRLGASWSSTSPGEIGSPGAGAGVVLGQHMLLLYCTILYNLEREEDSDGPLPASRKGLSKPRPPPANSSNHVGHTP